MEEHFDVSPTAPPKARRRSSIFEKRLSTAFLPPNINDALNVDDDKIQEERRQKNLQLYTEELQREQSAWKEYYLEKKSQYTEGRKQLDEETLDEATLESLYKLLKKEDAEFLSTKPDFSKICREWSELCRDTHTTVQLVDRLAMNARRMADHIQEKMKREILERSLCTN